MQVDVKVIELGHGSDAGVFTCWLKNEGDAVGEGEAIAEIMTEKANVEVPSPAAGVLRRQHVGVDAEITPDTVIATIEVQA